MDPNFPPCFISCSDSRLWAGVVGALFFLCGEAVAWVLGRMAGRAKSRCEEGRK